MQPRRNSSINEVDLEPRLPDNALSTVQKRDDVLLAKLGYKGEFKREFSVSLSW